jgi:hypothetical protein
MVRSTTSHAWLRRSKYRFRAYGLNFQTWDRCILFNFQSHKGIPVTCLYARFETTHPWSTSSNPLRANNRTALTRLLFHFDHTINNACKSCKPCDLCRSNRAPDRTATSGYEQAHQSWKLKGALICLSIPLLVMSSPLRHRLWS